MQVITPTVYLWKPQQLSTSHIAILKYPVLTELVCIIRASGLADKLPAWATAGGNGDGATVGGE